MKYYIVSDTGILVSKNTVIKIIRFMLKPMPGIGVNEAIYIKEVEPYHFEETWLLLVWSSG